LSRDFGTIAKGNIDVLEGPVLQFPGIATYYQIQVKGTGTLASATMVLYDGNTDISSTNLTGSLSIPSGSRVIKTKVITGLTGGKEYRATVYFTDGGIGTARQFRVICPKLGVNPSRYQFSLDRFRIAEAPLIVLPGQSYSSTLTIAGYGVISAESMVVYKGTSDDSATVLSGSTSILNRVITLKTISGLSGGSEYIAYVFFTDGDKQTVRYFEIICPKLGAN